MTESELHRSQLVEEWGGWVAGVHSVTAALLLVVGLATFQRGKPPRAGAKRSWLQTIFKAAGWASTMWLTFNSPGGNQKDSRKK